MPTDASLPPLPTSANKSDWAFWGLTALAGALVTKLPSKLAGLLMGKLKGNGKHVSKGEFLVAVGELKETIHAGQQSTERYLALVNDNLNATRVDVSKINDRVNDLYSKENHGNS